MMYRQTFSALGVRNFRLFAIGQGISLCGAWAQTIAQVWLILQLTHSGTQLGLTMAAQFLPVLLLGAWGGILADRHSRRRILYLTQSASALLALLLGLLVISHVVQIWMVYVISVGFGLIQAVDSPTRQSFMMEMVGKERVKNAVTLNAMLVNAGRIVGPSIAGILISFAGLGICFLVNAGSYLAVIIALLAMHREKLFPSVPVAKERGQIRAGLNYAWGSSEIRSVLIMMFIISTLALEFPVTLPLLAERSYHGGAGIYSLLTTVMSVGALLGGLYIAGKNQTRLKEIVAAAFALGVSMVALALMPGITGALIVLVLVGALSMQFIALTNTLLQLIAKPEMRGRVMALFSMAFLGTIPLGALTIGFVTDHTSPVWGVLVGGLGAMVAAGIGLVAMRSRKIVREPVVNGL